MVDLRRLAEMVDDEFEEVTVILDNADRETLVVHTDSEAMADRVESFLQTQGARTDREWYEADDVRVIAVSDQRL